MHRRIRIWREASWLCITGSALAAECHRLHGAAVSQMVPRLGLIISLRQASSLTTPCTPGYLALAPATVRTLQAFSEMCPNQTGDSLNGWPKSLFITAARLFMTLVITLRWSGTRRHRSVVRPHPPLASLVVMHSAFWCVATILRATMRISYRILQQLHQIKP